MSALLASLPHPIVAAPMAGGPSTPALAAAVSGAGGLGFLAAGYLTPDRVAQDIAQARTLTARPFGVNLFAPVELPAQPIEGYAQRMRTAATRWGVEPGEPAGGDDAYPEKVEVMIRAAPAVVSFAFGFPEEAVVTALHERGCEVWLTVTRPEEALTAVGRGADALVVQGIEAGAHRGGTGDTDEYALLPLLRLVAARAPVPLVAAGGIGDGPALAAVLAAGASAAALGTAFLLTPEAGTSAVHRDALAAPGTTVLTRAFTGRRARGIENGFIREHEWAAPAAYPHVHQVTAPLRAAARAAGDPDGVNLWAGQAYPLTRAVPAAELVGRLVAGAAAASEAAWRRLNRNRFVDPAAG